MGTALHVSIWLHIVAACAWVGGMIFLAVVVVPVTRGMADRRQAAGLIQVVGRRFRNLGWTTLVVLIITGFLNLYLRGIGPAQLGDGAFWASQFGTSLAYKLGLVLFILALSLWHDFSMGPKALRVMSEQPGSPQALRMRRQASYLGRVNMIAALAVIALAVTLVRGC